MLNRAGRPHLQQGITLLESLVSLTLLALVAFGLLGVQLRALTDARTTVHRAQAIRLIEDLGERIRAHPVGMSPLPAEAAQWELPAPSPACRDTACDAATLARLDILSWKQAIAAALPQGRGMVFETSADPPPVQARTVGVMVAWRGSAHARSEAAFDAPFHAGPLVAGVRCPAGLLCHLAHVTP
ncbi:prepilin-type N-terminal cleavage/methylation domain-containing protein [Variovorax saccharolyticus]|uniref:prepilin-type N-terminal cleavage/methylation domain-containing protein n=1 Tax=Variovorax saccharolyticus TaxID=3053516 RepID=UPI00257696E9|nr:prepilin-type N-terminal cleavage/methylation domain-containing protein [Variovorax sp. J31P216]MDM0023309.1 prepilin-type N-terminal cleavage/methylation domain-containing protein [Variovorax sp. J31P216]